MVLVRSTRTTLPLPLPCPSLGGAVTLIGEGADAAFLVTWDGPSMELITDGGGAIDDTTASDATADGDSGATFAEMTKGVAVVGGGANAAT